MSRRWRGGSTRTWRRIRAHVLARDGYRCQLKAGPECTTVANTVHHTGPREATGDDPAHLLAACAWCNGHTGDPTKADPTPKVRQWW